MTDNLLTFLDGVPTAIHTARELERRFVERGFVRLRENVHWRLERGGRYLFGRGASLIAWVAGTAPTAESGARIAVAHVDCPGLRLKQKAARVDGGYSVAPVEVYGSPIIATWVDRDLTVAGALIVGDRSEAPFASDYSIVPFDLGRACGVIPNLAVHLNRKMNESLSYNQHEHLNVLLDLAPAGGDNQAEPANQVHASNHGNRDRPNHSPAARLITLAAASVGVDPERVLDAEFFLCDGGGVTTTGLSGDLFTAAAIDNRAGCLTVQEALCSSDPAVTSVAVFYDHEEIGSRSATGADSTLLQDWLRRVVALEYGEADGEAYYRAVSCSTVVSNDAAHAVHPSYRDRHDRAFAPVLGGGPVLKIDANQRYAGSPQLTARMRVLSEQCGCPLQELVSRADMRPGSTVGPFTAANTGMATVDVGIPILAMHSIRETAARSDVQKMQQLLSSYYES